MASQLRALSMLAFDAVDFREATAVAGRVMKNMKMLKMVAITDVSADADIIEVMVEMKDMENDENLTSSTTMTLMPKKTLMLWMLRLSLIIEG